jgi:hypothetical protein
LSSWEWCKGQDCQEERRKEKEETAIIDLRYFVSHRDFRSSLKENDYRAPKD